jgi:hypothetical protein
VLPGSLCDCVPDGEAESFNPPLRILLAGAGGSLNDLMRGVSSTVRDALLIDQESLCSLRAAVNAQIHRCDFLA